jgi:hypothetical protein
MMGEDELETLDCDVMRELERIVARFLSGC